MKKTLVLVGAAGAAVGAYAETPTSLDGFQTVATGYIATGTTVAIAAAVLGMGWVGYRIVKKFTKGAMSS